MVGQLAFSDRQLIVGIYEQLITIFNAVPNLKLCDGKIIIIENNLFTRFYPCCISKKIVKQLYEYYQQDDKDLPEELEIHSLYYGDVLSLDDTHYFVSLIDKHTDKQLTTLPIFRTNGTIDVHDLQPHIIE